MAYCAWLGGDLPTVEQWHHAARGASVQRYAWGNETPNCDKHPRARPSEANPTGCCTDDSCDPGTFYSVEQRPEAASPTGLLDVLLTPSELVRGTKGSSVSACDHEKGACVVQGILPGAIDYMENIPQSVTIYGHSNFTPEMVALGQILLRASEKVREAVYMLSDMKNAEKILRTCEEISEIEGEADHVMRAGMRRLFAEETDARTLIRSRELYDLFEEAVDSCQDVADVIHGVVLERI
jgi:hypothetical protein